MIKHIVMWKVEAKDGKSKVVVLEELKAALEGLSGQMEGLIKVEVGLNYNTSDTAYDAVLYSEFIDEEALCFYQKHEKHQEVANTYVRPYTLARSVVDYKY